MKVRRIGVGYYDMVHHGHCFSLTHGCDNLWRLYLCNSIFDTLDRLVIARTKKDAMNILKGYDLKTIERFKDSKFSRHKE